MHLLTRWLTVSGTLHLPVELLFVVRSVSSAGPVIIIAGHRCGFAQSHRQDHVVIFYSPVLRFQNDQDFDRIEDSLHSPQRLRTKSDYTRDFSMICLSVHVCVGHGLKHEQTWPAPRSKIFGGGSSAVPKSDPPHKLKRDVSSDLGPDVCF
ncbi:hypothetical protein EVAR_42843_1 [Eumeta japonica]|uniref:Uncharacterized protein n=1 Tax=Eumeta variegata TaxID=151549 RepID=A0A4C1WI10_EUMVA|nr:hypothetical protein EVAR_42843_1 [Eumeta japonica]